MLKITAILILMFIGNLLAAGRSCNSCGLECAPACGTRRFRTCCFNYLRKKRGPDMLQVVFDDEEYPHETFQNLIIPYFYDDLHVQGIYNRRR